jgi:hypothetical protein
MSTLESEKVDILWGAEQIARAIGRNRQQTFYLLKRKELPAKKLGRFWVSSKKALREFAEGISEEASAA